MLHIFQSNRLDALADAMLDRWAADPGEDVLAPQLVIVPSRAVERWLTWRIADRFGVCAHVRFRFAAAFIWEAFASCVSGVSERSPFDTDVTALRLFSYFARLPRRQELQPVAAYLAGGDDLKRLELARRVARILSQYMVYRPEWLEQWARGARAGLEPAATEAWQMHLWRWLIEALGAVNVRHPKEEFFATLARDPAAIAAALPRRVRIFGLPSMPPLYAEIFARLAAHVEVEWHCLNPCAEYWADIASEKDKARRIARDQRGAELVDVGHPLLASWGAQGRANLALLAGSLGEEGAQDHERFVEPARGSLLHTLQRSILHLAEPAQGTLRLDPEDRSLQVHACHSLTRQVEALHDQLLALFQSMPDLRASEVLVCAPDIDAAAPIVDAVFGSVPASRHIPYAITGRARPQGTPLLRAVDQLLSLPGSRFEAASVLGFMKIPAVARRYALDESDFESIERWLRAAGVRWGIDARQRAALDLPAEPRHTWQETLYRLLVGYAMPADAAGLCQGVLPYADLEGSQSLALGKLLHVLGDLVRAARELGQRRRLQDWPALLSRHFAQFLEPTPDDEPDQRRLRAALAELAHDLRSAGGDETVGIDVVRALLAGRIEASAPGGVPSGQVNFAGIGPMRGLPYRVVCLIGLDDDAFPRNPSRLEFDLMRSVPRLGDRSPREDDRGAMLDALMCAQDVLYLGYTGRSIRDNAALPPSVLVAELLDYVGRCAEGGPQAARRALVTEHALQPFSPRYFGDGPLFTYAEELAQAARAVAGAGGRIAGRALFDGPVALPADEDSGRVTLDELIEFFRHPVRHLLRDRLGIRIAAAHEELPADEPFALEVLDNWGLENDLLRHRLEGRPMTQCLQIVAANPLLPHGAWGRELLDGMVATVEEFATRVESQRPAPRDPLAFELPLGDIILAGSLSELSDEGLFFHGMRKEGARDFLASWIRHLVLCILRPAGVALRTRMMLRAGGFQFGQVADATDKLAALLAHYRRGLTQPLPFPPRSAFAYARAEEGKGLRAAATCWRPSKDAQGSPGECQDPWHRLAYGGERHELPEGFEPCARAILEPALALREDLPDVPAGAEAP